MNERNNGSMNEGNNGSMNERNNGSMNEKMMEDRKQWVDQKIRNDNGKSETIGGPKARKNDGRSETIGRSNE